MTAVSVNWNIHTYWFGAESQLFIVPTQRVCVCLEVFNGWLVCACVFLFLSPQLLPVCWLPTKPELSNVHPAGTISQLLLNILDHPGLHKNDSQISKLTVYYFDVLQVIYVLWFSLTINNEANICILSIYEHALLHFITEYNDPSWNICKYIEC